MKHQLHSWSIRNTILAGIATACVLAIIPEAGNAAPSGDQFSIRLGRGSIGYSTYGRGQYGYGNGIGNGFSGNRGNAFPLYGRGPYGYQNGYQNGYRFNNGYDTGYGNSGYTGWNPNYNTYAPYTGNYYNPYSTWTYSPFGFGIQQSYGW